MRRICHINDAQALFFIGDIGVGARHGHAVGIPRRVVKADLNRVRWVGDVDDAQPTMIIGDVGVSARHYYAMGIPRRIIKADLSRVCRIYHVDDTQAAISIGDIGVATGDNDTVNDAREHRALALHR